MAETRIGLLDVVRLQVQAPRTGVRKGQTGTVVEILSDDTVLVEFCDLRGRTLAIVPLAITALARIQASEAAVPAARA